ncbi:MAG: hypothetical protein IIZ83_07995 [Oscillospiraceae bacterium]|nr:hypothetical protein [Oscillospiraceae bacterium]
MSDRRHDDFEDDGRTVADMSGVTRRNIFGFDPNALRSRPEAPSGQGQSVSSSEGDGLTRRQRLWAILGAMKAILLIGLCFAVGMAAVILAFLYL